MVFQAAKKQTSDIAKKAARQILEEPLEILKKAPTQIAGTERPVPQKQEEVVEPKAVTPQEETKIKVQGQRQLAALEQEIKEIQIQQQQEELAKARKEETLARQKAEEKKEAPKVSSRPSRRLFAFGQKAQAEKQKTRVEKPLPPSG